MIHPRSFFLLHNSDKAEQSRSEEGRTEQSMTCRIKQGRAGVKLYRAVHLMDE